MDAIMEMQPGMEMPVSSMENAIIREAEDAEVITIKNINKSYMMGEQPLHVLKDISLTVKKGEYLAVLGPPDYNR